MKLASLVLVLFVLTLQAQAQGACAQLGVNCGHSSPAVLSPDSAYFNPHPVTNNGSVNRTYIPVPPSPAEIAARQALAMNEQGLAAYNKQDWASAEAAFKQCLQLQPGDPVYLRSLALTQEHEASDAYKKGDLVAALSYLQQSLANDPASDEKNNPIIRSDLAFIQGKIAYAQREEEQRRQDKITANNMQQSIQNLAQSLNTVHSSSGLDFKDGKSDTPAPAGYGANNGGLDFMTAPPGLRDAVADTPSDKDTENGSAGYRVAKPKLKGRPSVGSEGDFKAGDQLLGAAATAGAHDDLTTNYDRGGGKTAGSFTKPSTFSADPRTFSPKVQHDKRMVDALKQLDALNAKRTQLSTELERLTVARGAERVPAKSQELTKQLNQKNDDFQVNLVSITKAEETVKKTKRTIETEVQKAPPPVASTAAAKN